MKNLLQPKTVVKKQIGYKNIILCKKPIISSLYTKFKIQSKIIVKLVKCDDYVILYFIVGRIYYDCWTNSFGFGTLILSSLLNFEVFSFIGNYK